MGWRPCGWMLGQSHVRKEPKVDQQDPAEEEHTEGRCPSQTGEDRAVRVSAGWTTECVHEHICS